MANVWTEWNIIQHSIYFTKQQYSMEMETENA